jgi:nucleoside-diphosphate-sugar epimerase
MAEVSKVLFIGCGDIAQRAFKLMVDRFYCCGLRRNPQKLQSSIKVITADASDAQQLLKVASQGFDIWVATLTPSEFTRKAYKESYLAVAQSILETVDALPHPPKLIIWVSSTSVYGDNNGQWVDETTKPNPVTFSGEILLHAEKIIQNLSCSSTLVRFSGIYGPGRARLLNQVQEGKGRPTTPEQWSNRIHADDCGGVLAHLIDLFTSDRSIEPVYLASDSEPVTQHDIRKWIAGCLSIDLIEEPVAIGPARRCSNRLLLESGFNFKYPSFKEGYAALIEDQKKNESTKQPQ